MRKGTTIFLLLCFAGLGSVFSDARSFDDIFPSLNGENRDRVFTSKGLIISTKKVAEPRILPSPESDVNISLQVLSRNPSCFVESLLVIPYAGKSIGLVEVYNALLKVRDLKGRLYHSYSRDDDIPLFEDATRIESPKKNSPIPDPPNAVSAPAAETIYILLRDINFGNSFYRADITTNQNGLAYCLSNFRNLSYFFIPVIKEDKFIAQLYLEPLAEGVLVYGMAGADVSDFIASQVDIPSAIRKRLEVIIEWVSDGIKSVY
jgi:hypothetical protein